MDIEIIKARLSLFGDPGVFIFPEGSKKADTSKYRGLESALELNKGLSCAVGFTPNGNYGSINTVGATAKRKETEGKPYYAAIYVDLDFKASKFGKYENKEQGKKEYFKYIKSIIEVGDFQAQFAVKSGGGGRHLYSFIDYDSRITSAEYLKGGGFLTIEKNMASMFDGGDSNSHSLCKLLRLPGSIHCKEPVTHDVELYKVVRNPETLDITFELVTKPEQVTLEGLKLIKTENIVNYLNNMKVPEIKNKKGVNIVYSAMTMQINQLNMDEILSRLEKYPRENADGTSSIFKVSGDRIYIMRGGKRIDTDGYKVWREKNCVHCFSKDNHPIDERPRGPVYAFLYYYFGKDMTKMGEFFKNEFNIDFVDGGKETYMSLPADKGVILFQNDGVYYHKTVSNNGQTTDTNEKLFNEPFIIKGLLSTCFDKLGESEEAIDYTIINLINRDSDRDIMITYQEDRKKFNKVYGKTYGLMFLKGEFDLIDFYDAIKRAAQSGAIKKFEHVYLNGYYPDKYVLGDKVLDIYGEEIDMKGQPVVVDTQNIIHISSNKDVTVSEYGESLRKVFADREAILAYTAFLALLMGDKFWKTALNGEEQQIILPGLFMSGITKSGKSTMINLLLNGFGLSGDCRKYSVKGTTLQPLKQAATDDFICHREEFTGEIGNDKETVVRDVLNKTKTARGLIDGSNSQYIYRSSLVIDGEQLPESESVTNRCVTIPFLLEDRIGTQQLLRGFNGLSYRKDFITKLYDIDRSKVKKEFMEAQDRCIANNINDRYSMIYSFLLCVNKRFNIYLEFELLDAIKDNFNQLNEVDKTLTPLAKLLSDMVTKFRLRPTISENETGYTIILTIPSNEVLKRRADLIGIARKYGNKRVIMKGANLVITLYNNEDDPLNKELYSYLTLYSSYFNRVNGLDINGFDSL